MSASRPGRQAGPRDGGAGAGAASPGRPRALLAIAVLLLCVLGLAPLAVPVPAASAVTGEEGPDGASGGDPLAVELTALAPAVLVPDADLTLTGTVTNTTTTTVERPTVRVRMQLSTPISRSILERWLEPDSRSATTLLAYEEDDAPLAPGEERRFTVTVPAGSLPLTPSYVAWGPRGLEVEVSDPAAQERRGSARSFLLWWPELDVTPTPVGVLGALVPTAAERVATDAAGAALADTAAPRLGPLLEALDRPVVDVALDPALLGTALTSMPGDAGPSGEAPGTADPTAPGTASAGPTGDEAADDETTTAPGQDEASPGTASPAGAGPPEAGGAGAELLAALTERADGPRRDVHALPWADADVAALAHAERTDLVADAVARTVEALDAAGLDASTDLAWPVAEVPDRATVGASVEAGAEAVVLPADSLAAVRPLTYTPTGRATLDVDGREVPAVLADERMSAILSGTHRRVNADGAPDAPLDDLTARQFLLAESAVISRERPSDGRGVLLTLPRDFAGDAEALAERLDALADAPWVDRVGIDELLAREAPELERDTLPVREVEAGEMSAAELETYSRVLAGAEALAHVTPEPERLLAPVREALLPTLSAAWRSAPDERDARLAAAATTAAEQAASVAAQPGSTLNLINDEAHIPVSVTNGLDQSVRVQVRLEPRDVRLVAEDAVTLEVPAQQSATAQVPVRAIGSGDVAVDVLLESVSGEPIGVASEIQVRVRADWENVGTGVVAGLLVLMLVIGLVRTVRRGRRRAVAVAVEAGAGTEEGSTPADEGDAR
ncbi:DUF6049 family protein [Georgenia sp. MJ206]|uniref:DUF6049 family protein n=1 Tax=Georgenia wangjunii TaxID=3117730 RepID=UPI002F262C10